MPEQFSMSRRTVLNGAVAGIALTATGLFLPHDGDEAAARDDARCLYCFQQS